MATFATINAPLNPPDAAKSGDEPIATSTPRPQHAEPPTKTGGTEESGTNTPTIDSFGGVAGQRPLPDEPLTPARREEKGKDLDGSLKRDVSQRENDAADSGDVEMGDGEEHDGADDDEDNDSVTSESQRPSKKKKGQRFFCTDFPPCQLSFTRSEHLARHIRKHTGERPFQCHCSRRFSRLDNLRQHAQTVHVNEEIPGDSLAATSTRFQRQIRTDRVRPPPSRQRASTTESQRGGNSRGHSRNVSTSSIGSTASSIGTPEDTRRRPQPLAIANDPAARARPTLDTYNALTGSPGQQCAIYNQSPTGYSTPTSQTSLNGPGSPHFSAMGSPPSSLSRSSFYNGARHAPGRRLSVPSAAHPYQQHMQYPAPAYFSPIPSGSSATFSQSGSMFGSPTSSIFSHGRRDSETELEYRRRTWHSGTYGNYSQRPATSGLSYHQTPDDQRPAPSTQPAASQVTRLPGIESFDHAPPTTQRQPSPMVIDARPPSSHRLSDAGLHHGITRLDITAANAPAERQWQAVPPVAAAQPGYFANQPPPPPATVAPHYIHHSHSHSMPEPITPRKNKRHAWYGGGPVIPQHQQTPLSYMSHRPSPEDSGSSDGVPTPSTSQGTEYHPVIVNPHGAAIPEGYAPVSGMTEEQRAQYSQHHHYDGKPSEPMRADSGIQTFRVDAAPAQQQTYALQAGQGYPHAHSAAGNDMGRLEALVAVATSEGRAMENRH